MGEEPGAANHPWAEGWHDYNLSPFLFLSDGTDENTEYTRTDTHTHTLHSRWNTPWQHNNHSWIQFEKAITNEKGSGKILSPSSENRSKWKQCRTKRIKSTQWSGRSLHAGPRLAFHITFSTINFFSLKKAFTQDIKYLNQGNEFWIWITFFLCFCCYTVANVSPIWLHALVDVTFLSRGWLTSCSALIKVHNIMTLCGWYTDAAHDVESAPPSLSVGAGFMIPMLCVNNLLWVSFNRAST